MLSEVCILDLNIGDLKPLENLLFEFKKLKIQSMAIQHSDVAATLKNYEKLLKNQANPQSKSLMFEQHTSLSSYL